MAITNITDASVNATTTQELALQGAIEYSYGGLLGLRIAPKIMRTAVAGKYPVYFDEDFARVEDDVLGEDGESKPFSFTWSRDTYQIETYGRHHFVPRVRTQPGGTDADATLLSSETIVARMLRRLLLEGFEYRLKVLAETAGSWNASHTKDLDGGGNLNFEDAGGDGKIQILDWLAQINQSTGLGPGAISAVIPLPLWHKIKIDTNFLAALSPNTMIDTATFTAMFGLRETIIANHTYNSTKKGQTGDHSYMWNNNDLLLLAFPGNSGGGELGLGEAVTFRSFWWDAVPSGETFYGFDVPGRGLKGGTQYESHMAYGIKATGVNRGNELVAGYYARNVSKDL